MIGKTSLFLLVGLLFFAGSLEARERAGGHTGGGYNPFNWNRWLYTGDPNASDEIYRHALEGAGRSIVQNPVHTSPHSPLYYAKDPEFWRVFGDGLKAEYGTREGAHNILDGVGFIPVVGDILGDGTNGFLYYLEGDRLNAGVSFAAVIPVFGDIAKGPSAGLRIVKLVNGTTAVITSAGKTVPSGAAKKLASATEDLQGLIREGFHGKKPKYMNPGTHDPTNTATFIKNKSLLPSDAEAAFKRAVPSPDGKTWYAKSSDGNSTYRYSGKNGDVHWNGATGPAGRTGGRADAIADHDVPKYVRDRFDAQDRLDKLAGQALAEAE